MGNGIRGKQHRSVALGNKRLIGRFLGGEDGGNGIGARIGDGAGRHTVVTVGIIGITGTDIGGCDGTVAIG